MAEKSESSAPMTTGAAKSALGRGIVGPSNVPSSENVRAVENLAIGRSAKRETERVTRRVKLTLEGVKYFIDDVEVSKATYFAKPK